MSELFRVMEKFCRRPQGTGKNSRFYDLLSSRGHECLSEKLAAEGWPLWRYSGGVPFDETAWSKTLSSGWKKKGSFPTLYRESSVYDRREVVICFLLTCGVTLSEADALLDELSVRNQSYEVRRLYPLHFKEGFFRLVIAWNERHTNKFSFPQAVAAYQDYEVTLMEELWQEWNVLRGRYPTVLRQDDNSEDIHFAGCCHKLSAELWERAEFWTHPFGLAEQDELQRLIVLMAHEKRALDEVVKRTDAGVLERNKNTKPAAQRGTRLCQSIIDRCAKKACWGDAVGSFLREAVPAMGEAYWRAISWVMKLYGESGGRGGFELPYVRERIHSIRNKRAKTAQAVSIFSQDPEQSSLSFSLDIAKVKELVRSGSANTVRIAELLRPALRNSEEVFGQTDSDVSQTLLSLLLNSYQHWLEGKTSMQSQGEQRFPMPFYDFKRETVLKYALACGRTNRVELNRCMEFAGYKALDLNNPTERLVDEALRLYEEMPYVKQKRISPISLLMDMQMYLLYFSARDYWREQGGVVDEVAIKKRVRTLRKGLLYEPDIPELSEKRGVSSRQDCVENLLAFCFLAMLALEYVSMQSKGSPTAAEAVLTQWEIGGEYWRDVSAGFLLFMDNPQNAGVAYVTDRIGDPVWSAGFVKGGDEPDTEYLSSLFQLAGRYLVLFMKKQSGNSSILKIIYESWFLILSMLVGFYGLKPIMAIPAVVQFLTILQDSAVLWTFLGGSRNFSIAYYERRFHLNHFAKKHVAADHTQESRWLKYLHDMKEDIPIWEDLLSDANIIHCCFRYIQDNHLFPPRELEVEYARFQSKTGKVVKILEQLETDLADRTSEEDRRLRKKLASIKRQLNTI